MSVSRYLKAARDVRHITREWVWRRRPPYSSPYPFSFPVPDFRDAELLWPRQYSQEYTGDWMDEILDGFSTHLPVSRVEIPQPEANVACFELRVGKSRHPVTIDFDDLAGPIDRGALARSAVYFKMQFGRSGYEDPRIVPGGYVTGTRNTYYYLEALRKTVPCNDVSARFSLRFAGELRTRAVTLLTNQRFFRCDGALKLLRYSRFLESVAGSKVCVDLPGKGAFCFRLIDYMAVGTAIVAYPHANVLHVPLVSGDQIIWCREDLSDLVDLIRYYLDRESELLRLRAASREYFDRYLHRDQLAAYYLSAISRYIQ